MTLLRITTTPSILVVDDDNVLQALLAHFLPMHGFVVQRALNTEQANLLIAETCPMLVILDILMPGMNGLEWIQQLRQQHPTLPVIIVSSQSSYEDRIQSLELGADDYIAKPFHPKELLMRIHNVLRHHNVDTPYISIGPWQFFPEQALLRHTQGHETKLTTTEAQLLLFFHRNAGRILSRDAISVHLHGIEDNPLDRRIDMRINRLRKKLEPNTKAEHARHLRTVWRQGYRFTS